MESSPSFDFSSLSKFSLTRSKLESEFSLIIEGQLVSGEFRRLRFLSVGRLRTDELHASSFENVLICIDNIKSSGWEDLHYSVWSEDRFEFECLAWRSETEEQ